MAGFLSFADFWKLALPLLGAVIAWFMNEWRKRLAEQYMRKEDRYKEMLRSLRGFYLGAEDSKRLKTEFLNQLTISWLYCPDEVIRKGYEFLDTVHDHRKCSDEEKEKAMGDFVAAIRKDILARRLIRTTSLSGKDFKHLTTR